MTLTDSRRIVKMRICEEDIDDEYVGYKIISVSDKLITSAYSNSILGNWKGKDIVENLGESSR